MLFIICGLLIFIQIISIIYYPTYLIQQVMITKGQIVAYLGMLNGMIGGTILVLPLLGMETGYLLIPCITILFGLMSFYTCYLIVLHLGQCQSLKDVILEHFNNKFYAIVIYDLVISLSFLGILMNYFQLAIKQVEGFLPQSQWIGIGVFLLLIALTIFMRYLNFGERLLAFGILSIVAYVSFLIWSYSTAEYEPKRLPPTAPKFIDLGAALMMGYSIHNFFVQVLYKTTTNDKFKKVVLAVYISGILIYTFITYAGYSVINRSPRTPEPETISQYFSADGWQVRTIQIIYLFHLLTASPEFCIIMKGRMLEICGISDEKAEGETKHLTVPQLLIYVGVYGICYIMYLFKVKISSIIQINGSVIGFFYVSLMPIGIHIKCVYFSHHDQSGTLLCKTDYPNGTQQYRQSKCKCRIVYKNQFTRILELVFQAVLLGIAAYTMYYTIYLLFNGTSKELEQKDLHTQMVHSIQDNIDFRINHL